MRNKKISRSVIKLSEGLLSATTDLILIWIYTMEASVGKSKNSRGAHQISKEVAKSLENCNYQTIKQTFAYLTRKGLIRSLKEPLITRSGKQRLKNLIPQYQSNRHWDKVVYLITYDIPETKKQFRNNLRNMLKTLGAAPLQVSVWLTPYNPQQILQEFSQNPGFEGEIIVSCIGKDGYIGNQNIKQLINQLYQLDALNQRYQNYLNQTATNYNLQTIVSYLSILKDDPQLPFALLPDDWLGEKAYQRYQNSLNQPRLKKKSKVSA